jgi:hypothetical protein
MVATVIATVAVIGLAYSFSLGRGFINRFEMARAGLATAQQRLELLHETTDPTAMADSLHERPFNHGGREAGVESWTVAWYDDPGTPGSSQDLKLVTVTVRWSMGGLADSVRLSRLFLP